MKVIFLDIDGVLNWHGTEDRYCGFYAPEPLLISRFNRIIEAHPDAKIVVSSTWRHSFFGPVGGHTDFAGLIEYLAKRGLKGEIIDRTPVHFGNRRRGDEIREWIEDWCEQHPGEEFKYVILDDDNGGMEGGRWERYLGPDAYGDDVYEPIVTRDLKPYHVMTSWCTEDADGTKWGGLQDSDIEKAVAVLAGGTVGA